MRELFRRHAKQGRETDRVGLLNDDQVAINSDQEEEFTTSMDQDVTTVSVCMCVCVCMLTGICACGVQCVV